MSQHPSAGTVAVDIPNGVSELIDHRNVTRWHDLTQAAVNAFADVSGDRNPLHLDTTAAASTPFPGTIAHGAWLLSVVPPWFSELIILNGIRFAVLTGYEQIRFPVALPVGSRVRMHLHVRSAQPTRHGAQICSDLSFQSDRVEDRPVCTIAQYRVAAFL